MVAGCIEFNVDDKVAMQLYGNFIALDGGSTSPPKLPNATSILTQTFKKVAALTGKKNAVSKRCLGIK